MALAARLMKRFYWRHLAIFAISALVLSPFFVAIPAAVMNSKMSHSRYDISAGIVYGGIVIFFILGIRTDMAKLRKQK